MADEIIKELWHIKDEMARKAKYDIHVLCRELRKQEATSDASIIDRSSTRRLAATGKKGR
jgi:hypothetical protein